MKKIVLMQCYEISLPKEYEDTDPKILLNDLNRMYDIHGLNIIQALSGEREYYGTILHSIDDENVYLEDNKINKSGGQDIFLDGQPRD